MPAKRTSLCLLILAGTIGVCAGQEPPAAASLSSNAAISAVTAVTNSPVRLVEPGVYEIGRVRLDQRRRSITFPALLNRTQGPMEYLLVTTYGKTHESVLKTATSPFDIHVAMLLLGARGSSDASFPGSPANGIPGPVVNPSPEAIPGDKAAIEVEWKTSEGETRRSGEDLVYRSDTQAALPHGKWVYNGSLVVHGKFLAQEDGSLVSLVTDPVALINSVAPGHDNDEIWFASVTNAPPAGVPVEVTIQLLENKAK